MFDGVSNNQHDSELLQIRYPKITVIRGVEHTVSLFFNDVSKIPVVNHMITAHKAIYNLFGSGIILLTTGILETLIKIRKQCIQPHARL